nr:hypothetical protein [Sphingobacterium sp. HMA12]
MSTLNYNAAKAGPKNCSKRLSYEVTPKGGRVSTVSPVWTSTTASEAWLDEIARNAIIPVEEAR